MKNPNFPALCFLTLAYCAGFVIITLVLLVVRSMQNTRPTTGVNAQTLAPIFEPVGSINTVIVPISNRRYKKPKVSISALIREEFGAVEN
jgi:hypothetical protein